MKTSWKCWQTSTNVGYPVHDADLTRGDGSTYCARCGETTGSALPYTVKEYDASDGGIEYGDVDAALAAIAKAEGRTEA